MKTLIVMAAGAIALYQVAKRYNINSVAKLKKTIMPHVNELVPKIKNLVPQFHKVFAN